MSLSYRLSTAKSPDHAIRRAQHNKEEEEDERQEGEEAPSPPRPHSMFLDLGHVYGGDNASHHLPNVSSPLKTSIKIFAALGGAQRHMLKTINKEIRRGNRELDSLAAAKGTLRGGNVGEELNRWAKYRRTHDTEAVLSQSFDTPDEQPYSRGTSSASSSGHDSPNRNIRPGTELYSREWFGFPKSGLEGGEVGKRVHSSKRGGLDREDIRY